MASNEKKRKNKKEKPNDEKRVINKWSREDSGMLIDMVQKNPAIWNTKSKEYIQGGAGNVAAL